MLLTTEIICSNTPQANLLKNLKTLKEVKIPGQTQDCGDQTQLRTKTESRDHNIFK